MIDYPLLKEFWNLNITEIIDDDQFIDIIRQMLQPKLPPPATPKFKGSNDYQPAPTFHDFMKQIIKDNKVIITSSRKTGQTSYYDQCYGTSPIKSAWDKYRDDDLLPARPADYKPVRKGAKSSRHNLQAKGTMMAKIQLQREKWIKEKEKYLWETEIYEEAGSEYRKMKYVLPDGSILTQRYKLYSNGKERLVTTDFRGSEIR